MTDTGVGGTSTNSVGPPSARVAPRTPFGPLLDDRDLDAGVQQRLGGAAGFGLADGDLALLLVADGDGHVRQGLADLLGRQSGDSQNIGR